MPSQLPQSNCALTAQLVELGTSLERVPHELFGVVQMSFAAGPIQLGDKFRLGNQKGG